MESDKYSLEYVLCSEQSENAGRDAGELLGMKRSDIIIYHDSELAKAQSISPADVMTVVIHSEIFCHLSSVIA